MMPRTSRSNFASTRHTMQLHQSTHLPKSAPFKVRLGTLALAVVALAGCAQFGPAVPAMDAKLPATIVGGALPTAQSDEASQTQAQALNWITQPQLRDVIARALNNNTDLRVAIANIERARAQFGIADAARLPTIGITGQGSRARTAGDISPTGVGQISEQYTVQLGLTSYEIDFWGRVRNLSEAALQQFLQTESNRRNVELTLVSDISNAWLTLAADLARLELARETLASREKAFELTERMHQLGATSGLVLAQNRSTVETARGDVAAYTAQVARSRNALELLVGGGVPAELLPTARTLAANAASITTLLAVPDTLPSAVLLARPDVISAEHNLRALSANVGAARASLFPNISLTTSVGTGSRDLDRLFASGNGSWSFVPQVRLPIFDGGALRAQVAVAQANRDAALAQYEKAIQFAFKETSDILADRTQWDARLKAQSEVVAANARALELSEARFKSGVDNYLSVLDAQRSLYAAQQTLIGLRQSEQANRIAMYKVFGGGITQPGS